MMVFYQLLELLQAGNVGSLPLEAAALLLIEQILVVLARENQDYEEPLRADLTCYQVLRAANNPRAHAVLEKAHAKLQEQAAKITDEAIRHSFLHNVPYHGEIVAAWGEPQSAA